MVSIGRLIFKATGVMSNRGLVKNSNKIGTAIAEKMRQSGGKIENAEVQEIISDTIGKKAAKKIKILGPKEEAKNFLLKQRMKPEDINEAFKQAGGITSGEHYKRASAIFVNDDYLKELSRGLSNNPEILFTMRVNTLAHEIQHAISATSGYLSLPKIKGKFSFGRKMIDKDIAKTLKYDLQSKYLKLQMASLEKMETGKSLTKNDIIEILYSKGILTPGKDKENAYILKSLKKIYADEVRSYNAGFAAAAKYAGIDIPVDAKNVISLYKNLSEGAAQELKHTRMNQIKRFLGIKPDMSREENIIRQSQESERLAAELLSRFSETIKNSKSKPISFN